MEAAAFQDNHHEPQSFATEDAARCWLQRVEQWEQNLRQDLIADSVVAPGMPEQRWLLWKP
eukprot:6969796-Karenia_brevis.AAC.1